MVSKILYLRQHYHFGPGMIADYLKRFHQVSIATSSVHRLLGKHGMSRLPANSIDHSHTLDTLREAAAGPPLAAGRDVS